MFLIALLQNIHVSADSCFLVHVLYEIELSRPFLSMVYIWPMDSLAKGQKHENSFSWR